MEVFLAFMTMVLMVLFGALLYKNRKAVARWLNDPELANQVPREIILKRKIEDTQRELEFLQQVEKPKTETAGG